MSGEAHEPIEQQPLTESDRLGRLDPPPVDDHPLRKAPERLARVSEESAAIQRLLWVRVNQEIERLARTPPPASSPVMPGGTRPARRWSRAIRRRPDL